MEDLDLVVDEGSVMDDKLMQLERTYKQHSKLDPEEVKEAALISTSIQNCIKEGKKKADALKGMISI